MATELMNGHRAAQEECLWQDEGKVIFPKGEGACGTAQSHSLLGRNHSWESPTAQLLLLFSSYVGREGESRVPHLQRGMCLRCALRCSPALVGSPSSMLVAGTVLDGLGEDTYLVLAALWHFR